MNKYVKFYAITQIIFHFNSHYGQSNAEFLIICTHEKVQFIQKLFAVISLSSQSGFNDESISFCVFHV